LPLSTKVRRARGRLFILLPLRQAASSPVHEDKRGLRFCGAVTLGRKLPLNARSEQGEVGFAESLFCRLSLMPIRVKQDRLADCIQPGTFLCS